MLKNMKILMLPPNRADDYPPKRSQGEEKVEFSTTISKRPIVFSITDIMLLDQRFRGIEIPCLKASSIFAVLVQYFFEFFARTLNFKKRQRPLCKRQYFVQKSTEIVAVNRSHEPDYTGVIRDY